MELTKNNISTIAVFAYMLVSPCFAIWGINIDQGTFTSFIVGLIGLIIAIYSSKNPNTIKSLGNAVAQEPKEDDCA